MSMQRAEEASLSRRQAEIAKMLVAGKSTREIAVVLALSPRTVETHIAAVYNKYGVSSRTELLRAVLTDARSNEKVAILDVDVSTNLPPRRAGLLGRSTDIANIRSLLRECRLVTVTGAGGVGKTRTALAIGDALLADSKAGVWLVELAALTPGASVADAFARALNIELTSRVPSIERLCSHLRHQSPVIILDNCEHVVADAAAVTGTLMSVCPGLRILATSREPLRIAGERTYRLPSLGVPSPNEADALDAPRGSAYASIALFTQRAAAVNYDFALTNENVRFVAEICRRVDGIPLAIELAAARVNILPVRALAAVLESRLQVLAGGDRMAVPRHQTMQALIDWSYDLLSPAEQRLFEQLAVSVGGCALPETIAAYGDDAVDDVTMLGMLSSLVDKSLVVADTSSPQPRYEMMQTFARYGREKLTLRGDVATFARRHALVYLDVAERLEAAYDVSPSPAWFEQAQREFANCRAALAWTLERRNDVPLGQRLASAMRPMWRFAAGAERWLGLAEELIDERTPPALAAAVSFTATSLRIGYGQFERAAADCRQLGEAYAKLGDPLRLCQTRTWEGFALFALDRACEAEPPLAGALELARKHGYRAQIAYLLSIMASIRFSRGDVSDGRAKYAESIAIFESLGAQRSAAMASLNLADAEFGCDNIERAVDLATKTLIAVRRFGLTLDIARGLIHLAAYCIAAARWTDARSYAREALHMTRESQGRLFFDALLHFAAIVSLAPVTAQESGLVTRAVRIIGFIDRRFQELGYSRELNEQREYDRVLTAIQAQFSPDVLAMYTAEGAAMTTAQAVELATAI